MIKEKIYNIRSSPLALVHSCLYYSLVTDILPSKLTISLPLQVTTKMTNITLNSTTVNSTDGLELCGETKVCLDLAWTIAVNLLNSMTVIANVLHLVVLGRMHHLKGMPYRTLLQAFSVTDIALALTFISLSNCEVRLLVTAFGGLGAILSTVGNSLSVFRFYIIAVASQDRYSAICRPFEHYQRPTKSGNLLKCSLLLLYVSLLAAMELREYIFYQDLCLDYMLGPTLFRRSIGGSIITTVITLPAIFFTSCHSYRVVLELHQMKRLETDFRRPINSVISYILLESVATSLCLLPLVINVVFSLLNIDSYEFLSTAFVSFQLHGSLSTVIYGWVKVNYRREARRLLSCKPKHPLPPIFTTVTFHV